MTPARTRHEPVDASEAVALEIEVEGRWDALALSERLIPFHSFLVQHDSERWVVHARSPGCHGEPLDAALAVIDDWRSERAIEPSIDVRGQPLGDTR